MVAVRVFIREGIKNFDCDSDDMFLTNIGVSIFKKDSHIAKIFIPYENIKYIETIETEAGLDGRRTGYS